MKPVIDYESIRTFFLKGNGRTAIVAVVVGLLGLFFDANKLSLAVWVGVPLLFVVLSFWPPLFIAVRKWMVLVGAWLGAGMAWAMVFASLARWLFDLEEETALLWVGLPVLIAFLPFCVFILPKHLRKAGIL